MSQNRNNQERDDSYVNTAHSSRAFQNRPASSVQMHPNLNAGNQNPLDLVYNYNRNRQPQEPEENIYERLDNDEDDENAGNNGETARNEPAGQNNQNILDEHTYERIDDRYSCSGRPYSRCCRYHTFNHYAPNLFNDMESRNHYDQPRQFYLDSSRMSNQFLHSRLGRLGRNCFSTENIAYTSTGRTTYPLGHNCTCSFCRHLDTRWCHHCHILHNRLRYQDGFATNFRHYIYQLPRNCRCPVCRGEYAYVKLPVASCRPTDSLRIDCHCRNPTNCSCRCKVVPNCNTATQFSRYLDIVNRGSPSVNNPLYATVQIGSRSSVPALGNSAGNLPNGIDPGASTSNMPTTSSFNEPSTSSNMRPMFVPNNPSTSHAYFCTNSRSIEHQHTCDDSCIRSQSGSVTSICQFLGRCERTECNHGRLSVHWWFINRWLPSWNPHYFDRNMDAALSVDEESREQQTSDSDEN